MTLRATLRSRLSSVGTKIAGATLLVLLAVTWLAYTQVSRHERESLLAAKADAGEMLAALFAAGLVAPISFSDDKGVQELANLVLADEDVLYGAAWSIDPEDHGRVSVKLGEAKREGHVEDRPGVPDATRVVRSADRVLVETPVKDASGAVIGVAQVALSLAKENAAIRITERRTLGGAALLGLGVAIALLALTRVLIVRRLARLAEAAKGLEDGTVVDVDTRGGDEVGDLARAFVKMSRSIATREARIAARNHDMRRVLDNVAEGFLTVSLDGTMSEERSRVVDEWFGAAAGCRSFFDYLDRIAPEVTPWVRLGWSSLADDFMPVEVTLDQLARRFQHRGRSFDLEFRAILDGTTLTEVLVVARDVSERVERERAEQAQREAIAIVRRMLADRAGFQDFMAEGSTLVDEIIRVDATDRAGLLRAIHTLKGITGLLEVESVASFCHELEQRMIENDALPTASDRAEAAALWGKVRDLHDQLGGAGGNGRLDVSLEDHARLVADLESGVDRHAVAAFARSWADERASLRIERLAAQLPLLARRLGKGDVEIRTEVTPSGLRVPSERLAGVWPVLSHLVRNALDHGIESAAERRATNKQGPGRIGLSVVAIGNDVEITVSDDGGGIPWERLRASAAALGLPCDTDEDLEEALFAAAVSSRDAVTETSGRGVGMAAVREAVVAQGGTVSVTSEPGIGTSFHLHFPDALVTGAPPAAASATRLSATEAA